MTELKIYAAENGNHLRAGQLARRLGLLPEDTMPGEDYSGLVLRFDQYGLALCGGGLTLQADFSGMKKRLLPGNMQKEMLIKAVRIKGRKDIRVLDATAGMGEDALLLAAAGFRVDLYEYDPVIGALLEDALARAAEDQELSEIVSRMKLHQEDSIAAMNRLEEACDVVFLDPMFPERQKSAMIKKKFQLLQQLESPCCEESELLLAAKASGAKKIVIKRPLKGPNLAGVKPSYSLSGKAIRYDCILL